MIFVIVLIFSQTIKKYETILRSRRKFEKLLESRLHYFRCPNCNEIFTIKKSQGNGIRSFITTCPYCGTIGRIPSMPKSV